MRMIVLMSCAALALGACQERPNRIAFDGVFYKAKTTAPRLDRKTFVTTVKPVSKGVAGARAAAQYEATKHCIRFYGTSAIDWTLGPDTERLQVVNDTATFAGVCKE